MKSGGAVFSLQFLAQLTPIYGDVHRSVDGVLLEGQEGPGASIIVKFVNVFEIYNLFYKLFARRGKLDEDSRSVWTSFEMVLREPTSIPPAFDLARFLASSITFMIHLEEISVYFNDWCLIRLKKAVGLPQVHQLPRGLSRRSPNNYMSVSELKVTCRSIAYIVHYIC